MTVELLACVERSNLAERAGDVTAALEWHQAVPQFRKGRHRSILDRLASLGDELPEWVWARWIVYQLTRCEDGETGALIAGQRSRLIETWHFDLLRECFESKGDPVKVAARVLGESWAVHQEVAHELGGLAAFVEEHATGRLAEHAELAASWARARMSGYGLGESLPQSRLRVREAGSSAWFEVLDLGARSCAPGGWVIGRLVASGVGDLRMFDMPPLEVPELVAMEIARAEGAWSPILAAAIHTDLVDPADLLREDYELVTDVGELELVRFGTAAVDYDRVMRQLRTGRDEVRRAAYRILARAGRGDLAPADQAYVAAALLNPSAFEETRRRFVHDTNMGFLCEWSPRLAEPARGRLQALVAR